MIRKKASSEHVLLTGTVILRRDGFSWTVLEDASIQSNRCFEALSMSSCGRFVMINGLVQPWIDDPEWKILPS